MAKKPTAQAAPTQLDIDKLVGQYVALRDKIKEADDQHKQKTKTAREYLEQLNGRLLEALNSIGGESIKTEHGTVYKSIKRSATIADGEMFRAYVTTHGKFDLVDWRANSTAVADYIVSNRVPPPGVNYSTAYVVGVRRA